MLFCHVVITVCACTYVCYVYLGLTEHRRSTADQPQFTAEHSVRLTDNISIFAAELTANKLALLSVINTVKADICILSDSFSYLQAVSSGKSISRNFRFNSQMQQKYQRHLATKPHWHQRK